MYNRKVQNVSHLLDIIENKLNVGSFVHESTNLYWFPKWRKRWSASGWLTHSYIRLATDNN